MQDLRGGLPFVNDEMPSYDLLPLLLFDALVHETLLCVGDAMAFGVVGVVVTLFRSEDFSRVPRRPYGSEELK